MAAEGRRRTILYRVEIGSSGWLPVIGTGFLRELSGCSSGLGLAMATLCQKAKPDNKRARLTGFRGHRHHRYAASRPAGEI